MADITLTPQQLGAAGVTPSYTSGLLVANTYYVKNTGRTILHWKKTAAVDCVVTIDTPPQVGGLDVAQRTVTVPATTGDKMIGSLTPSVYNNADGNLKITLSDVDGLSVAVLEP